MEARTSISEEACPLCREPFDIFAVGHCDHPVCHRCSTRMRVLCEQMYCAICRSDLPKVTFVRQLQSFEEIDTWRYPMNRKHKIFFGDDTIQDAFEDLLQHRCQLCPDLKPFRNFPGLKEHMRKQHELYYCDICSSNLKVFGKERKFYDRKKLAEHRRKGDEDDTSHKGHPLCRFCDVRYLDNDELMRHLRKDHYFCHFCEADGISNEFFCDYPPLRDHFRSHHFLCEEGDCAEVQFTNAFRSDIDLKGHNASDHSKMLRKSQSRQTRTIDIDINLAPRPGQQRGRGNRDRDRDRDRGGGPGREFDDNRRRGYDRDRKNREELETAQAIAASIAEIQKQGSINVLDPVMIQSLGASSAAPAVSSKQSNARNTNYSVKTGDFPTLDGQQFLKDSPREISSDSSDEEKKHDDHAKDTLAKQLARVNRFSVQDGSMAEEEFPTLGGGGRPARTMPSSAKISRVWDSQAAMEEYPSLNSRTRKGGNHIVDMRGNVVKTKATTSSSGKVQASVPSSQHAQTPAAPTSVRSGASVVKSAPAVVKSVPTVVKSASAAVKSVPAAPKSGPAVAVVPYPAPSWVPQSSKPQAVAQPKPPAPSLLLGSSSVNAMTNVHSMQDFPSLSSIGKSLVIVPSGPTGPRRPAALVKFVASSEADFPSLGGGSQREPPTLMGRPKDEGWTTKQKGKKVAPCPMISVNDSEDDYPSLGGSTGGGTKDASSSSVSWGPKPQSRKQQKQQSSSQAQRSSEPKLEVLLKKEKLETNIESLPDNDASKMNSLAITNPETPHPSVTSQQDQFQDSDQAGSDPEVASKKSKNRKKKNKVKTNQQNQELKKTSSESRVCETGHAASSDSHTDKNRKEDVRKGLRVKEPSTITLDAEPGKTPLSDNQSLTSLNNENFPSLSELSSYDTVPTILTSTAAGAAFAAEDFPTLDSMSRPQRPPPGLVPPSEPPKPPPPGFTSTKTDVRPPPGFPKPPPEVSVEDIENVSPLVNGSAKYEYSQPENFQQRNQALIRDIGDIIDSEGESFQKFKSWSGKFRQELISPTEYYDRCVEVIGASLFEGVFPELVALLPDIPKQQELLKAHQIREKKHQDVKKGAKSKKAWKSVSSLSSCPVCLQVLISRDSGHHLDAHQLDSNFPSLFNS